MENPSAILNAFDRAMRLSADLARGFSVDEIAMVEAAWHAGTDRLASYGWVVALKSGRRLYLEYSIDESGAAAVDDLHLVDLRPDQAYPPSEDVRGVSWYRPDDLNRHLGSTGGRLH